MTDTIRLATRGSDLALRQTQQVAEALEDRRRSVELLEVETTGDAVRDELIHRLGKTGAFVRSLDEKVLAGEADAAVHSMKDMPTEFPPELVVAGVPERTSAGDVLLTPNGEGMESLPEGATVGTSSLRRRAQLLAVRPDLIIEPLRGNVDTRVQKLLASPLQSEHERRLEAEREKEDSEDSEQDEEGPTYDRTSDEWFEDLTELERQALGRTPNTRYNGIVLAEAGLERLGLLDLVEYSRLPESFVPAPGQGALAVVARDGDTAERIRELLDHPRSRVETTVERTILGTLGGGCIAPIGVHAVLQGEYVQTRVRVLSSNGEDEVASTRKLPVTDHPEAAEAFANDLAARGADDLITRAREENE